ncbi:MAG: right-handed parallel beta-helix repeat-containing protein [Chloroflexota bacterium]|nr:right-handed parallel beta-helix repeat-containing protein [Chloroflexota bacterium]
MLKHYLPSQKWLWRCLLCLALLLPGGNVSSTYAAPLAAPAVLYLSAVNTILIGAESGLPASEIITIPELDAALALQGFADPLVDLGNKTWLLKANITINPSAQLQVKGDTVGELRIESLPSVPRKIIAQNGGHLLFDNAKVVGWDSATNAIDQNGNDGRSYLLALQGSRMDILNNSEVAYLGFGSNETSGVAWQKRLSSANATTGSTGTVQSSVIHHNRTGLFISAGYGVKILGSQVHSNLTTGISVRDDTQTLEVGNNNIYANAENGILFTRQSKNNQIHDNEVHDNVQDGIVVDQDSNNNTLTNNNAYGNRAGIVVSQSSNNVLQGNRSHNNLSGLIIDAKYNPGAIADTVATGNQIIGNTFEDNGEYGIYLYSRADRNVIANNTVLRTGINGIYIKSGGNILRGNTIRDGAAGITILGGENLNLPAGATQPLDAPGHNNVVISSTIAANSDIGIRIQGGSNNRIGQDAQNPPVQAGNLIEGNGKDGVAITNAANGAGSTDNKVVGNTIRGNGQRGVYVKDAATLRNRISKMCSRATPQPAFGLNRARKATSSSR